MATIKAFTDINQSRELAKILPLESADMYYNQHPIENYYSPIPHIGKYSAMHDKIPCWSLAALLNALPVTCDDGRHCLALINSNPAGTIEWLCCYEDYNGNMMHESYASNQVDACYEMIIKLNELKML